MKLGPKELRATKPKKGELAGVARKPVYIVLDDVMDTYNVGAIFRLADAVAATEVMLCGRTEYPPNTRIHKAAVGTEEWVPWRYGPKADEEIKRLRDEGVKIVAVEQDRRSASIFNFQFSIFKNIPVAIVVGHETQGISSGILDLADVIVEIPMWGVNKSLNVVASIAVVLYKILE